MSEAQRLIDWFRINARPLPWRTTPRDPYRSLVSELMAQQTQLDRVVPRYLRFVDRFPSLRDLAAAPEPEVLEAWSGLGYYRRARLLHRLAVEVAAGPGELPATAAELERLPGIGPYTAAAVASMVFGEPVGVFDGNVARVGSRFLALADDPRTQPGRGAILNWVERLMAGYHPGEVNEGLMELGALVCTPTGPDCEVCPIRGGCRASSQGDPERYPPPRKVRAPVELRWLAAIVEDHSENWLLRKVDDGPILRGLWLPPLAELDPKLSVPDQITMLLPFEIVSATETLEPVKHSITHRRIEVSPVSVHVEDVAGLPTGWRWADPTTPGVATSSLLGKLHRSVKKRP